jgi:hypothetical protein
MAWTLSLFLFLSFTFTPYHIVRGILIVLKIFFNPVLFKSSTSVKLQALPLRSNSSI